MGECYLELPKTEVEELLTKEEDKYQAEIVRVDNELAACKKSMAELKVRLYAKFGNSINLEEE